MERRQIFIFQLDKQYLKEVTGTFCDGDIQTLFEKNAEKRQALAEALRKDILENGADSKRPAMRNADVRLCGNSVRRIHR